MQQGKNYKLKELELLKDSDPEVKIFFDKLESIKILKKLTKPIIQSFEDFDDHAKYIYSSIAKSIKELNQNQENLYVIASGSRVNGKWHTNEEIEEISKKYNIQNPKYSDYDFITNAKNIPNLIDLAQKLNIKHINRIGTYNKKQEVNIPLNNL